MKLPPLSLYIHYPWCVKKCPYCDFNSHQNGDNAGYINALLKDLEADLGYLQGRSIGSIFIGGGTPSLMNAQALEKLFIGLKSTLIFAEDIEITLEANPSVFESEKFQFFKEIGINRLSIGVQSFNDKHLQSLGRIHNARESARACSEAGKIFDNFNIDLMYGLEKQTLNECLNDVRQAIDFNPSHVSFYQLTIEPNTYFAKFPPILPRHDMVVKMGDLGGRLLEENGFLHYEVSAFGKFLSKHNLNYWEFGDYIGIGAGAHGKISINGQGLFRTHKAKLPKDYLHNRKKTLRRIDNLAFEFMLNALRLKNGFEIDLFNLRTGQSINSIDEKLKQAQSLGLVEFDKVRVLPSKKGYNFLNDLQALFL